MKKLFFGLMLMIFASSVFACPAGYTCVPIVKKWAIETASNTTEFIWSTGLAACQAYFQPLPANVVEVAIGGDVSGHDSFGECLLRYSYDQNYYLTHVYAFAGGTCPSSEYTNNGTECQKPVITCPANATRSNIYPFQCTCNTGYVLDPIGGICVPVRECPVTALSAFPPANDACAQALENLSSTQAQKYAACGSLTPAMETGKACLESKLAAMTPAAIPFTMTANIRNLAYQAHFSEVWRKMEEVVDWMGKNPIMQSVCTDRRAEIAAEKGCDNAGPCVAKDATSTTPAVPACYPESATRRSHCLTGRPAAPNPNTAQHTLGNAIDVDRKSTIDPLETALAGRNPPQKIPQFLAAPTTAYPAGCNLGWGGEFKNNYDPVHFYVP